MATPVTETDDSKVQVDSESTAEELVVEAPESGAPTAGSAPKEWTVERATLLFATTTGEMKNRGVISVKEKEAWDNLAMTLPSHYDVFSFQVAMLWKVLHMAHAKAKRNYDRLLVTPNYGFMDKNQVWISCVLRVVGEHLNIPHSVAFPGEESFVPQTLTKDGRLTLRRLIGQLMEVAHIATCKSCGQWVAFDKKGEPFKKCKKCRVADKLASELQLLNEQLEEKKKLLEPLNHLLSEIVAAGAYWVSDEVDKGWIKAGMAFDNAFASDIKWHTAKVKEMEIVFVTGKITDDNIAAVEAENLLLVKLLEEVRTFKHLTWCRICKAPTYPWVHPKKKIKMKPNDKCDDCRHAEKEMAKVAEQQGGFLSSDDVRAAELAGVGLTSADGKVLAEPEAVDPVFGPGDKYQQAWDRKKKGQEKEKGKSKKK